MSIEISPRTIGALGGALVAFGVFTPIIGVPLLGEFSTMQNGHGAGVLLLACGIAGILLSLRGSRRGMVGSGVAAGTVILATYVQIQWRIDQMRDAIGGRSGGLLSGLGDLLTQSIRMEWGWAVLILGSALLVFSGYGAPRRPRGGRDVVVHREGDLL